MYEDLIYNFSKENNLIYLKNGVLDFTNDKDCKLTICGNSDLELNLSSLDDYLLNYLNLTIFNKNLLGWDIKNLYSYFKYRNLDFKLNIIDLKLVEHYFGIRDKQPENLSQAYSRFCNLKQYNYKEIYNKILFQLATLVVPSIENNGFYCDNKLVFPYYEIEGQENGRMSSAKFFQKGINANNISKELLETIKPYGFDKVILSFDIKALEVRVLQWLSGDEKLKQIIDNGGDLYKGIFELITEMPCNDRSRKICKSVFLPVIYGLTASGMVNKWGISEKNAEYLIYKIYKTFPAALSYVSSMQENMVDFATDIFGRRRFFYDKKYLVRNFCVQSPAAMLCLDKLINLHNKIKNIAKIILYVHDGYYIMANKGESFQVEEICRNVFLSESELMPGLLLDISFTKIGV